MDYDVEILAFKMYSNKEVKGQNLAGESWLSYILPLFFWQTLHRIEILMIENIYILCVLVYPIVFA